MSLFESDTEIDDFAEEDASAFTGSALPAPRLATALYAHQALERALFEDAQKERLPHGLIFSGPEGIGKSTLAFRLARWLLAQTETQKAEDPTIDLFGGGAPAAPTENNFSIDPHSTTFTKVAAGTHPDLLVIERARDERKGTLKSSLDVDQIRAITPFLRKTPSVEQGWRVVIVDDADTMNRNAQNAILKILEEPPPHVVLILIAHRIGAFLPTIRSRCRELRFSALPEKDFETILQAAYPRLTRDAFQKLSLLSNGSPGRAARLHEQNGVEMLESVLSLTARLPDLDRPEILAFSEQMAGAEGEAAFNAIFETFSALLSALTRAKANENASGKKAKLPPWLAQSGLARYAESQPMDRWLAVMDALRAHLHQGASASLDRRNVTLTAFRFLSH